MELPAILISIISSTVFSALISIIFLKSREKWIEEKSRRISLIFNDRYAAYKKIYHLLIQISDYSQKLYELGEKGYWGQHYSILGAIISCETEIVEEKNSSSLVIEDSIINILDTIHIEIEYYRNAYNNEEEPLPEEAGIAPKYYKQLVKKSEKINTVLENAKLEFKNVFNKKY